MNDKFSNFIPFNHAYKYSIMTRKQIIKYLESDEVQATLDQADAVSAADLQNLEATDILEKVTTIYKAIRPFLEWADSFFLFGDRIKTPIRTFKEFLDKVTGYVEGA